MVMIGREVRLPSSVIFGHVNPEQNHDISEVDFEIETKARLQRTHDLVRKQLQKSAERSKEIHDVKLYFLQYQVGDLVWFLHEGRHVGINPKLEKAYDGPFPVIEKRSQSISLSRSVRMVQYATHITTS
ncbi:hypothetical protein DPMN_179265 [Dreissena polymorpha]|uniref:Uncharacterized protein n=1 Tax=Dreissena polymorpha TaxID=45954 RepID=A0A9D4IM68_DREPO|nr:hypothetical protein DPMN_179265 [Dreissena polymorpha]